MPRVKRGHARKGERRKTMARMLKGSELFSKALENRGVSPDVKARLVAQYDATVATLARYRPNTSGSVSFSEASRSIKGLSEAIRKENLKNAAVLYEMVVELELG